MINSQRAWVIDSQLGILIQNGSIPKEDAWVKTILDWLIIKGLFIVNKKSSKSSFPWVCFTFFTKIICNSWKFQLRSISHPAFSDDLRRSCRSRLLSCLTDLNNQTNIIKSGVFSTAHRKNSCCGLIPVFRWQVGQDSRSCLGWRFLDSQGYIYHITVGGRQETRYIVGKCGRGRAGFAC